MSDSVRPHRRQPTRLPRPWDSPGKNTDVGCHFLLQCMKVKSESEVAQLCPTLSDPMDCSLPGSSIQEIFQARVLEWGAIAFSYLMAKPHYNWKLYVGIAYLPLILIQYRNIKKEKITLIDWMIDFIHLRISKWWAIWWTIYFNVIKMLRFS